MPKDEFIINELKDIDINKSDAKISKLPTETKRLIKEALMAHYNKALFNHNYKEEMENTIKKYETYILQDEIQSSNDTNAFIRCSKMMKEILF